MIKRNIVIAGITVFTLLLASGAIAFAASDNTAAQSASDRGPSVMVNLTDTQKEAVQKARQESREEAVASLVDRGTMTQETADSILADEGKASRGTKAEFCSGLTDEQRDALHKEMQSVLTSSINDLVSAGTITQEIADQLLTEKVHMSSLDLTDVQKDAIKQAHVDSMKTVITNLVEKGIITQAEADSITEPPAKEAGSKGDGIMQNLTDDQKTALSSAMKDSMESKLAALVDVGTITQDQADQLINDKGFPGMGHKMGPGGHGNPDGTQDTDQ